MNIKFATVIEFILCAPFALIKIPFLILQYGGMVIQELMGLIQVCIGNFMFRMSKEYRNGVFERNGIKDDGYISASSGWKAIKKGLVNKDL